MDDTIIWGAVCLKLQVGSMVLFGAETQFGVDVILATLACLEQNFTLKSMESFFVRSKTLVWSRCSTWSQCLNLESMFKLE